LETQFGEVWVGLSYGDLQLPQYWHWL